jgi:putative endonuclease
VKGRAGLGARGERAAARRLRAQGYRILGRNVRAGGHELDLIARDPDQTLVFVEVKTRSTEDFAPPQENLSPKQRRHIVTAARAWRGSSCDNEDTCVRYDLMEVVPRTWGKACITHHENAFQEDER